ncbi:MAG: type II secretion system secretin GspD [Bdellovibrionales bacterium]
MDKMKVILSTLIIIGLPLSFSYAQTGETYKVNGAKGFSSEETAAPKSKSGVKFSEAYPEEINNKNYPDMIDTFDYPSIEIKELVKVISELTGKRFILSDKVSGKISIISKEPITVAEAYKVFLSALQANDLTVVPSGKFLKIIKSRDAIKQSVETYTGSYFPDSDQMIIKIVKLKYIPAAELVKSLRSLYSKDGDIKEYEPTNSLIISDWGSNVEKVIGIIKELDVPGFEEKMEVIPIKYAAAKDIAELINKIINKGEKSGSSVPRFRRSRDKTSSGKSSVSLSYVTDDERTNSIIALGNAGGIEKAKSLVKTLDSRRDGDQEGGVHVYYVKYNDAEEMAKTLGGIADDSKKAQTGGTSGNKTAVLPTTALPKTPSQIFGSEVTVKADKNTNALIITASAPDYKKVKGILAKIDIPRDQVFVETIIMEITSDNQRDVGIDIAKIDTAGETSATNPATSFAVQGMFGNESGGLGDFLTNPIAALSGGILSFGSGDEKHLSIGGVTTTVNSVMGLVKLIQRYKVGNVLSTPKIMAMDNEEATLEVGKQIVVGQQQVANAAGTTQSTQRADVNTSLTITPSISPESNAVRLKIDQKVKDVVQAGDPNTDINTKSLITNIAVPNGDTAVLGGLVSEKVSSTVSKVPLLGDIPILGWLFRSKKKDVSKSNLMLFITPKIIRNPAQNKALLNAEIDKRLGFIKKNMNGVDPFGAKIDEISKINPMKDGGSDWDEETPDELKEYPAIESE